jgi:hypothetical protein
MHEFPGPEQRIRRILETALADCTYVTSRIEDDGSQLVLQARRSGGREVGVRFRGVKESEINVQPEPGAVLRVRNVKREGLSLVSRLFPLLKPPGPMYARVRIDAGPATLDVVCQDAEWWEE